MELEVTSDQQFFQETTRKFLDARYPLAAVRALRGSEPGFDAAYWKQGAELGWTSLLVSEANGGGSISGRGVIDLTLIAHEFGTHAAPGPLETANLVAAAIDRWGSTDQKAELLPGIIAGDAVVSWAHAEPRPTGRFGVVSVTATRRGSDFVLRGVKEPVESGAEAQHLLVSALVDGEPTHFVVPADRDGVTVRRLQSLDLTRRFARVELDEVLVPASAVLGEVAAGGPAMEQLAEIALVIQLAETGGAMQAAFDMAVEWAFNRYSFGRPLASYQELKHRFADMKTWLEASHAIAGAAARAVQDGAEGSGELVSIAKSYVGQYGPELAQDCVQMHGGIGVTFDHDMHLFLRRITVNRSLLGTPSEHRDRLVSLLTARQAAASSSPT